MSSAFGDYGTGALGGMIYSFVSSMLGVGVLGSLATPVIASSMLKGRRGEIVSTMAGFQAGLGILSGGLGGVLGGGNSSGGRGEM
tara:strand:+ start:3516 stop:3770 length:255 start_codon:yes stop_codon:yes gene_type:complete